MGDVQVGILDIHGSQKITLKKGHNDQSHILHVKPLYRQEHIEAC